MKLVGVLSTAVLSLSLGIGIPAYAQQEQHDQQEENKDKPSQEKEKEKAHPEKPATQEEKNANPQEQKKPEERSAQQQHAPEANSGKQVEHASTHGGRIPAARYKANFGQEHRFRVSASDSRNRRFQYGGYWFGFEQAWPSNWLYTQDVYVIEIDGVYYLCNASYPGVNLVLNVTL